MPPHHMPIMTLSGAAAGVLFGTIGPYPAPDVHPLTQCIQVFPLPDLITYAVSTPADCVVPLAGHALPSVAIIIGAAVGAAAALGARAIRRHSCPRLDSTEPADAYHHSRSAFEGIARQIEQDRAHGWVIIPSQAEAYWTSYADLQRTLAALARADPAAAKDAAADLLWRRPELSRVLPSTVSPDHPTLERLSRLTIIRFGQAVAVTRLSQSQAVIGIYTAAAVFILIVTWPNPSFVAAWTVAAAGLAGIARVLSALTRRLHP